MSEIHEFGPFGKGKPVLQKRSVFGKVLKWCLIIGLLALMPYALHGWLKFYHFFGENQPPVIDVIKPPAGMSTEPLKIKIQLADKQSGLDEVIIRAEQGRDLRDLLRKKYRERQEEDIIELTLNGKESGFHEGDLRLLILAFDRSFWSNAAKATFTLRVDYEKPRLEVISTQHNAVRGGVELVFYRVFGEKNIFSGVMAGSQLFPGFPAAKLDRDFTSMPDLYFAFFAIPLDFNEDQDSIAAFARDLVGNTATASFFYRIKNWGLAPLQFELPPEYPTNKADEVFRTFTLLRAVGSKLPSPEISAAANDAERLERLRSALPGSRDILADNLKQIFGRPKAERFWQGSFLRPPGRPLPGAFGQNLSLFYQGDVVDSFTQQGMTFASTANVPVRAANSGIVIFADDLGSYGKTVILDHGFGLTSLYGHLNSITHLEGSRIAAGDIIGAAGSTGFAWRDCVAFEIRLHGVPVRPEEWWDNTWIADHIEAKITEIKKKMGINAPRLLD
ncbi:MAG TPA: M23 family metallopeptidase [Oligoflexia bacterium]|nr:M23 family metallopeptidase [Oligoflexia bacterium]